VNRQGDTTVAIDRSPVKVTPESDLESLLDEATKAPLVLERNGVTYRLSRENEQPPPDRELARERELRILDETIGSWADLDTDKMIREIYEARRAGSRTPVDP